MSYHDPFRAGEREEEEDRVGGLFLLSSRTSRQVRPEFGLPIYEIFDMKAGLPTYEILDMKACRITTLFWGRGEGRGGGRRRGGGEKEREGERGRGKYSIGFRTVRSSPVPPHPSLWELS